MASIVTAPTSAGSLPGSPDLKTIRSDAGEPWLVFRKTLKPRFAVVWRDIALCHLMIFGGLAAACLLYLWTDDRAALLAGPLFGVWIGYWMHSLSCFGHEATHFNLAANRSLNDFLANWFVMSLSGLEVKLYRKIHWSHHVHLGDPEDTQVYYHKHPSLRFLVENFTGIHILKTVLRSKWSWPKRSASRQADDAEPRFLFSALARAGAIHLAVLAITAWAGLYGATLAWLVGLIVFPAVGALRQLLEHRADSADPDTDYARVEHGPINRMFANNLFSRTLGNAGFNRHMLHHWDPAISYSRFDEMEAFLMRSNLADVLVAARTTYFGTFWRLLRARRRQR